MYKRGFGFFLDFSDQSIEALTVRLLKNIICNICMIKMNLKARSSQFKKTWFPHLDKESKNLKLHPELPGTQSLKGGFMFRVVGTKGKSLEAF